MCGEGCSFKCEENGLFCCSARYRSFFSVLLLMLLNSVISGCCGSLFAAMIYSVMSSCVSLWSVYITRCIWLSHFGICHVMLMPSMIGFLRAILSESCEGNVTLNPLPHLFMYL